MKADKKTIHLEQQLREKIEREGLIPDERNVGEFVKSNSNDDKIRFLNPNNWVFHEDIVKKVLAGKYEKITPYSAEFVPTLNCTNRCRGPCSYCLQRMCEGIATKNDFKNPKVHMQSLEFAKEMMDKLADGGIKGVIFTGGGEPSLFMGLEDLMAYTSGKGIDMVLYTNGNSWSEKRIERVAETSPLLVRVSMNCGTKEGYNRFHLPKDPKNAFENVQRFITNFAKQRKKNPEMIFGVSFIINKLNYLEIPATARRLKEIVEKTEGGIDFAIYRPAFNYYGTEQTPPKILDKAYNLIENEVRKILAGTSIKVLNIKCRYDALKGEERGYKICRAAGLFAELGPSGELHSCCDRNCFRPFAIGDLKKNNIPVIYSSPRRKEVMDYANDNECSTCPKACKPHETNKQFEKIEQLRAKGELYKVELWIEAYKKVEKPKMANF